jgi:hypothetical protein
MLPRLPGVLPAGIVQFACPAMRVRLTFCGKGAAEIQVIA